MCHPPSQRCHYSSKLVQFMIMLLYVRLKSFILQSTVAPRKTLMQDLMWKLTDFLYGFIHSLSPATSRFMYLANTIPHICQTLRSLLYIKEQNHSTHRLQIPSSLYVV
jgi:hypothetical protein